MHRSASVQLRTTMSLRLVLPHSDPKDVVRLLSRVPGIAGHEAHQQQLEERYFDTPDQRLRLQRATWRTTRVDTGQQTQWRQALSVERDADEPLRMHDEWVSPRCDVAPEPGALLDASPWSRLDPKGTLVLSPIPTVRLDLERTSWSITRGKALLMEVVFRNGWMTAGDLSLPVLDLELTSTQTDPGALFDMAARMAEVLAVLPSAATAVDQGHALADGAFPVVRGACPPRLDRSTTVQLAASRILSETLGQFTANLVSLCASEDPEVVHQARVGWRRFKSACRFFRPVLSHGSAPSRDALAPLLCALGDLRDWQVALFETLPPLKDRFVDAHPHRLLRWDSSIQAVEQGMRARLSEARGMLSRPLVGQTLLATLDWMAGPFRFQTKRKTSGKKSASLADWSDKRLAHFHSQLSAANRAHNGIESQHRTRILAKRLRYNTEALQTVLATKRSQRWVRDAVKMQTEMGSVRDLDRACALAGEVGADTEVVECLRSVQRSHGLTRKALKQSAKKSHQSR